MPLYKRSARVEDPWIGGGSSTGGVLQRFQVNAQFPGLAANLLRSETRTMAAPPSGGVHLAAKQTQQESRTASIHFASNAQAQAQAPMESGAAADERFNPGQLDSFKKKTLSFISATI